MNDPLAHARKLFFEELSLIKQEFEQNPDMALLKDKIHRLKGGAGFLGYTALEDRARVLDDALKKGEPIEGLLFELIAELSNLLKA